MLFFFRVCCAHLYLSIFVIPRNKNNVKLRTIQDCETKSKSKWFAEYYYILYNCYIFYYIRYGKMEWKLNENFVFVAERHNQNETRTHQTKANNYNNNVELQTNIHENDKSRKKKVWEQRKKNSISFLFFA